MLGNIPVFRDRSRDKETSAVYNTFIDRYLADAGESQIKVYLYLLRVLSSGRGLSVSEIAEAFDYTERVVMRALTYWEKQGLVRLHYDGKNHISNISLEDPDEKAASAEDSGFGIAREESADALHAPAEDDVIQKRRFTADDIARLQSDDSLGFLLFAAEKYFKRPVNPSEQQVILYAYDDLGFPADLVDYLLQRVSGKAKGNLASYMEKTAIAWHKEGILTAEDAKRHVMCRDKRAFEIMRHLGLGYDPTPSEADYFIRWLCTFAFPMELVKEACRRTVFHAREHRVEYADGILTDWHDAGVKTTEDIARLDAAHGEASRAKPQTKSAAKSGGVTLMDTKNRFNRIQRQEYDFDELRKSIVSNQ